MDDEKKLEMKILSEQRERKPLETPKRKNKKLLN
uniref:Uncharacterized protein n=1 Tax=Nelumbo nucifera TaxID=4432 RepID=A0A822XWF4_NELNU|nr:TPA_asm: hypothetical protein HUJ06_025546 [Nelumbo nucifera]